jgi:malate permease and related proteins
MPDLTLPLLLSAVLPVFLIMGTGALLRRLRVMTPAGDGTLLALAVNVTYPCFILEHIVGHAALRDPVNVWLPFVCGAGFMIVAGALAWLAGPLFGLRSGAVRRTFALACSIQNYGYLPIPIMKVIWPDGGWAGVLFVYSLGVELVLWTMGVWLMDQRAKGAAKKACNPVVLSIVAGLGLNLLPWSDWMMPGAPAAWLFSSVQSTVHLLGSAAVPLGLLVVGATLGDLLSQPGWHTDWRAAVGGTVMRLAVLPAVMLGLLHLLPAGMEFRHVIAVQAAMPAAVFPMIIARRYGGDEATAMRVVVVTTLLSLLTIPFVLKITLHWAG